MTLHEILEFFFLVVLQCNEAKKKQRERDEIKFQAYLSG
jgi:hypothetical protein